MKATVFYSNGSSFTISHITDVMPSTDLNTGEVEHVRFETFKQINSGVTENKTISIDMDHEVLYILIKTSTGLTVINGTIDGFKVVPHQDQLNRELAFAQEAMNIERKAETKLAHIYREMDQHAREEQFEEWLEGQPQHVKDEALKLRNERKLKKDALKAKKAKKK